MKSIRKKINIFSSKNILLELEISLKRLGKKKVYKHCIALSKKVDTLEGIIKAFVTSNVQDFNAKIESNTILAFLTPSEIQNQSESGKIGFNNIENTTKADITKSIENALQAFEDGIFLVFIDDEEVKLLNEKIELNSSSTIVFIRMTFLAGTYW